MELGLLVLRDGLDLPEHLGGRGLVEADLRVHDPDRLQHPRDAERRELPRQHGLGERRRDERLRGEVVDLVRLGFRDRIDERVLVEEVAVQELDGVDEVRDPLEVADARAADEPEHLVALPEQVLGQVGAVLTVDAGDERGLHPRLLTAVGREYMGRGSAGFPVR